MPKYEVVEVIRKYWEVEADSVEQAYDLVMDGDEVEGELSATLVDEEGSTESVTEIREATEAR
jgi:septum formation topological specificity factor MinE